MALSEIDRNLLDRCLERKPGAWEDFVDRYIGLVIHVINHTAQARSIRLAQEDIDDLCAEVFLAIVRDDLGVLRNFRGKSSLATYLTVIARRVIIRELMRRQQSTRATAAAASAKEDNGQYDDDVEQRLSDREEVEQLLAQLEGEQAEVVRLYHLEGKNYREISEITGVAENSIGPMLSRAREKLRQVRADAGQA